MKKVVKWSLFALLALVLLVLAALLLHPLWLGSAVKTGVSVVGPCYTGTPIALSDCSINLYGGKIALSGFDLSNPAGCDEKSAARVGTLVVDLDTMSALGDVVTVRSIEIYDVFVSYVKAASGKCNFTEIVDHANDALASGGDRPEESEQEDASASAGKKVVVEKVTVSGIRLNVMGLPIPVAGTIVLTDIGKESNGVSWKSAWEEIAQQVVEKTGVAGEGLLSLGGSGVELGKKGLEFGNEGLTKAMESVKGMDVDGAKDALKDTGRKLEAVGRDLKGLFK